MAGAGGLFGMLIGALIGVVAGALALGLFAFQWVSLSSKRGRTVAIVLLVASLVAILLTLPAWIVIVSGKDTRGEPFDRGEIDFWLYLVLATPPVTVAGLARRLWKRPPP